MAEERNNVKLSDFKNKKKAEKKQKKLSDEELEQVSGGYWETLGYAAGYWIECPLCGRTGRNSFDTWADDAQAVDQFRCVCGAAFAVDTDGMYYY